MSTQVYSSHQQTRQQLDELDALLQRMLSLPLHAADPAYSAEPMSPESFAPLPPTLPQSSVRTRPAGAVQAWRMAAPTPANDPPLAMAVDSAEAVQAMSAAPYPYSLVFGQPLPAESPPPLAEAVAAPPSRPVTPPVWAIAVPAYEEPSRSLLGFPFRVLNFVFDIPTYLLGPLGTGLRHPIGRNILGWLGIVMILGAIGWAAADFYKR